MARFRFLPLGAALLALPAAAQAAFTPVQVGSWTVGSADATSCQALAAFGEHLVLGFSEDPTGIGVLMLSDDRWKLAGTGATPGTISYDAWKTSAALEFTPTQTADGDWLLITPTGSWFTEDLAGSKRLWLKVPAVQFEQGFAIDEATELLTAVATCNESL